MTLSRQQLLHELGITPLWVLRETASAEGATAELDQAAAAGAVPAVESGIAPATMSEHAVPAPAMVAPTAQLPSAVDRPVVDNLPTAELSCAVETLDWPALTAQVAACRACPLGAQRRQAVLGVGDQQAEWLFVGEGPGAEEDARGEPFVGQAGKLLDNMLAALGLDRQRSVYIANAVKCRPPNNRTPEAAEMAACRPYLERQIALLRPRIIVLLGKAAVHSVLGVDKTLGSLRGQRFEYAGIPVVVTYHPAYLLRNLPDKAKAWEDLLFARRVLRTPAG